MIEDDLESEYSRSRQTAPEAEPSPMTMSPQEFAEHRRKQRMDERTWYEDIGNGLLELPKQVLGGARDAVQETLNATDSLGKWLDENVANLGEVNFDENGISFSDDGEPGTVNPPTLPTVGDAETVTGGMIRSVSQFLTGFAGGQRALSKMGVNPTSTAGQIAKGMGAAGVADGIVFDPKDPRLSNLINEYPALKNPVTEYLESKPGDTELEGRFKNTIEGFGLGGLTEGLLHAARGYRAAYAKGEPVPEHELLDAEANAAQAEANAAAETQAPVTGREEEALDAEAQAILSEEQKIKTTPLVQVSKEDANAFADLVREGKFDEAGKSVHINLARVEGAEDIHKIIKMTSDVFAKEVGAGVKKPRSHSTVQKLATEMDVSVEHLNKTFSGVQNLDSHVLAVRQLLATSAERVWDLAEKAAAGDKKAIVELRQASAIHASIQAEVKGVQTEVARALSAMRVTAKTTKERHAQLDGVIESFGGQKTNEDFAKAILESRNRKDGRRILNRTLRGSWYARSRDALITMRTNGLLSNPSTHTLNIVSNFLALGNNVIERQIAAGKGGKVGVQEGESIAMINGMVSSFMEAIQMAGSTFKSGIPSDKFTKMEIHQGKPVNPISGEAFEVGGMMGKGVDYFGTAIGLPGRLLVSSDEFFKTLAYRGEVHARAWRKVQEQGLSGKEARELYKQIIVDPPRDIKLSAVDFSHYSTFTKELGSAGKLVERFANTYPTTRLFMPFIRTPLNLLKYAGERTPVLNKRIDWIRKDLESGDPARKQLAEAKLATGKMFYMTGISLAMSGQITGAPPSDPELRRRMIETGWKPYALKMGDTYYPFDRADPFGLFFGATADLATLGSALSDEEYEEAAGVALASLHGNLIDKHYLKGLAELIDVMTADERSVWKVERLVKSIGSSMVPYSSLLRGVTRANDPVMRESKEFFEILRKNTPGFSDELPPIRNIMGDPVMYPEGAAMNLLSPYRPTDRKYEPVLEEIARLKIDIKGAEGLKRLGSHELTLEQKDFWSRKWGMLNKKSLVPFVTSKGYENIPDGMKAMQIEIMLRKNKAAARAMLIGEYEELPMIPVDDKVLEFEDLQREKIRPRINF